MIPIGTKRAARKTLAWLQFCVVMLGTLSTVVTRQPFASDLKYVEVCIQKVNDRWTTGVMHI